MASHVVKKPKPMVKPKAMDATVRSSFDFTADTGVEDIVNDLKRIETAEGEDQASPYDLLLRGLAYFSMEKEGPSL